MGATQTRTHMVAGLPLLILITAACVLACAVLLALPAAAGALRVVHVDLTQNMQAINGYGFTASSGVTVSVFASPPLPGGTPVWTGTASTEGSGAFSIPRQAAGFPPLSPGMLVRARDNTTSDVKELTLAALSFNALRWDTDVASGTAPPGATVEVFVSTPGLPTQDQLTVVAGPGGAWSADFGAAHGAPAHTFDVLYGMFANAHVQDGDQDATTMGSPPPPFVAGELDGRIWGGNWAHGSSVSVQVRQGTNVLYSHTAATDENGGFAIEPEAIGFPFAAGMIITVSDANYTKELTLADLTFVPLDVLGDTASGTAPAGASVKVRVWTNEESAELTVTANGSGAWEADFGAAGFDIVRNTDGEARYWEPSAGGGDGDSTVVHPQSVPTIYAGQRSGIGGGGFAPDASVDVEVTDTDGVTTLFSDTAPTDANGGFDVQEGTLAFEFAPGMVVKVTGGTWTKELTLVSLTFDLIDPATDVATGTGPAGATVSVDVNDDSGGATKEVTVQGDVTWTADFSPFNVTSGMNGGVAHFDDDGDATRAEWYPPRIQALYSPYGWDNCSGNDFTPNTQLTVSLYQSDAPGASLLFSELPMTDGQGSFGVGLESVDLAPGMKLVVFDPQTLLSKRLILVDLWVDVLDPDHDTVSGTATAGSSIWMSMMGGAGDDLGRWEVTADGSGVWSVDCKPADLDWASWGEAGVQDADGDETRTEAYTRRIECDLVGDTIGGMAFSRGSAVTASVFASGSSAIPLWSGAMTTDSDGRLSVTRSVHGLDLTGGMRVRIDDASVPSIIKQVTLTPLTFDELDAATDTGRGTGAPGAAIHLWLMGPDGGGEAGYPTPDANGDWSWDFAAFGADVMVDTSAGATVYDDELDSTSAPFVPHIVTLQSATHPSPDAWYANHDPAFSWTPSPSARGYSWVLDQSPTTVPDETIDGSATSCAYAGKADGVWYFHIRVFGGRDALGGGYWGATSHLAVRIDSTPPAIATLASSTHGAGSVWSTNNDPVFEWTTGAGAGDIAGYSWVLDQAATTTPDETIDGTATRASFTDVADGVWYMHVRARDVAGNWGAAQHAVVRIDAGRPTPRAYPASVRRGKTVSVGYRLDDPAGGCGSGTVKIAIKNACGKVVKTKTISGLPVNVKKVWKFACRFPAGRYTISVTGSDLAGNAGPKVAKAVLRVR